MPEMALDIPQIHDYLLKHVMKPLLVKRQFDLKFIEWVKKEQPKEKKAEESDDIDFDSSNNLFMLLANLILYQKELNPNSWEEVISWFNSLKLSDVTAKQLPKLEDAETFWVDLTKSINDEGTAK